MIGQDYVKNDITGWFVASVPSPDTGRVYNGWSPCIEWCSEQWGNLSRYVIIRHGQNWRYVGEGVFEFENEQDYVLFLLKWGGQ